MKHYVKPKCKHECRFIQVSDNLWLCPHAAYGEASYLTGAVEDARRLLEKAGGYDAVLARLASKEDEQKQAARQKRESKGRRLADSLRYK